MLELKRKLLSSIYRDHHTMKSKEKKIKRLRGTVFHRSGEKTISVLVSRFVKHPKYGKYLKKSKKYQVHDEENVAREGEAVEIEECRPISKNKSFRIVSKRVE